MQFQYSVDLIRPAVISVTAATREAADAILAEAETRGNIGDNRIVIQDEQKAQELATIGYKSIEEID